MNARNLQSLVLSCLHDLSFLSRLELESEVVRGRYGCSQSEIDQVLRIDKRLFQADLLRSDRMLTGLCDLFPVTLWSMMSEGLISSCRGFFQTDYFHDVLWKGGFIFEAFADFLQNELGAPDHYLKIELGLERVSLNRPPQALDVSQVQLSHCTELLQVPEGVLDSFLDARNRIISSSCSAAEFLLAQSNKLDSVVLSEGREYLLVEFGESPSIGPISSSLGEVLDFLRTPRQVNELEAKLVREGAEPEECSELIRAFVENGWIVGQVFSPMT